MKACEINFLVRFIDLSSHHNCWASKEVLFEYLLCLFLFAVMKLNVTLMNHNHLYNWPFGGKKAQID